MQDPINLSELKQAWLSRLEHFKRKKEEYSTFMHIKSEANIDLNVDDLINPPKEEKIERAVEQIVSESIQEEKIFWNENLKRDFLENIESNMDYVDHVKENLDTVRPEPLTLATLLADKKIVKADDIDKEVASLSLHSFKDIDHKVKLRPMEKNYIINPLAILKEKGKTFTFPIIKKDDLVITVTIYHSFTGKKSQVIILSSIFSYLA